MDSTSAASIATIRGVLSPTTPLISAPPTMALRTADRSWTLIASISDSAVLCVIFLRRYREKALFCLAKVIRYTLDEGKSRVCRYIYGISKIWRAPNEFPVSCEPIMIISSFFGLNGPSVGAVQQKHAFGVDDAD
jgi:hypothetical protein